jgi:SAM-dependent methyltransferase
MDAGLKSVADSTAESGFCLETLSEAVQYYDWVYSLMCPYLGQQVLELGAGIGNLTTYLLGRGRLVTAIDTDERIIVLHRHRVPADPRLLTKCVSIQELSARPACLGQFDSVVSSNVLEHLPDEVETEVVRASFELLRPGGFSVHWVPAFQTIFGSLDRAFMHHRRYRRNQLRALFRRAGFEVVSCQYWNLVGFFGWWFTGRILCATGISSTQMLAFDRYVVPVIRRMEPWVWRPFGQSILIVARRPELNPA